MNQLPYEVYAYNMKNVFKFFISFGLIFSIVGCIFSLKNSEYIFIFYLGLSLIFIAMFMVCLIKDDDIDAPIIQIDLGYIHIL